ncbi:MAG: hypothetical protein HN790_03160 [Methylococcales bacterium]|jgi:hypothetical protein|nr:hypothetical protein [Methylococcales bacterium]
MSNSEVLLKQMMDTVNAEGLLAETEIRGIEKLILSSKIKEEDWLTALENTHFKEGEEDEVKD